MIKFKVLDLVEQKEIEKEVELSIVAEEDIRENIIHEVIVCQLANRRQGTKDIKNEAEVSGSGRKPWKQKGTGRARRGSNVSAGQRGGGFPHKLRTVFKKGLNKKVARLGLQYAISNRWHNQSMQVISSDEDFLSKLPKKTSEVLSKLNLSDEKLLFVLPNNLYNEDLYVFMRSCTNLHKINFIRACGLNVYDVIKHDKLLIFSDAVVELEDRI